MDRANIYNMQLHNLQPKHRQKAKKRIGRGGKRGTFSGRGVKGQKSRAGTRKGQPVIRELIKRYPKLKGYRSSGRQEKRAAVNLSTIEKRFALGEKVSPRALLDKKIINKTKGKTPKVKILGRGDLTKRLVFENVQFSKAAQEKIKKV